MTTFTASEVRATADSFRTVIGGERAADMLHAYADRLEADEKAQPVTWVNPDDLHNPNFVGINAVKVGHEGLGKHYTLPLYTHPDPADAKRLAEALRVIRQHVAKDPSAIADSIIATCDSALAAHSAQAQPPAASVPDGFVFERVNMGRGNERYVGLADGSEGTTVQEDGDGPGDTRSRLLWRIADAALAAQENPNG